MAAKMIFHILTIFCVIIKEFYAYCDQIELHLKTAMQCMQQLSSAQHYIPGHYIPGRTEPYLQDNPTGSGPMPYPTFLNTYVPIYKKKIFILLQIILF